MGWKEKFTHMFRWHAPCICGHKEWYHVAMATLDDKSVSWTACDQGDCKCKAFTEVGG